MNTLSLNGEPLRSESPTLQALLVERGYDLQAAFARALNLAFVPRPQWPRQTLCDGDRIDVITPVTGG
jgi:sulfur carrier protein